MLGEKRFRLFYAQMPDMFGDAAAVILIGNFIEICFPDTEAAAQVRDADIFGKVGADIFVDPDRQFFSPYDRHAFQTQIGSHSLHDMGDGGNIIFGDERTGKAGGFQGVRVDAVGGAFFPDDPVPFLMTGVGKYVAEKKITDYDIAKRKGRDAFGQSGMAAVSVGQTAACGHLAGFCVAAGACCCGIRVSPYDLAAGRDMLRVGGQFMEGIVEDGDPQSGNPVKILQQGIQFGKIKGGNHESLHNVCLRFFLVSVLIITVVRTNSKKIGRKSIYFLTAGS